MIFLIIILLLTMLTLTLTVAFSPYISRKNIVFGVGLPDEVLSNIQIKKWQKNFFISAIIGGLVLMLPTIIFLIINKDEITKSQFLIGYYLISFFVYLFYSLELLQYFRKKVLAFKQAQHLSSKTTDTLTVSTTMRTQHLTISNTWLIGVSLCIVLLTLFITFKNYDKIPETLPLHWGVNDQVDRFGDKSIAMLLQIPGVQLLLMGILAVSNRALKSAKQKLDSKQPEQSLIKNSRYRLANSKFTITLGILVQILLMYIQFIMISNSHEITYLFYFLLATILLFTIVGTIYIAYKYGQGGDRYQLKKEDIESNLPVNNYTEDDAHWKLGLFYINKKDPSIWVEKRFGLGMTMNFGAKQSWFLILGLLILLLLLIGSTLLFL